MVYIYIYIYIILKHLVDYLSKKANQNLVHRTEVKKKSNIFRFSFEKSWIKSLRHDWFFSFFQENLKTSV